MAADQQFCLRWNNHQSTLVSVFDSLLEKETLVDCTLAAEGQYLKAHKVVLCACSPYLETLLSQHYEKHPIVILKDVKFTELKSMMDYMYRGEVNISQDQLGTFLKAAESLQIKGLSENGEGDARDVGSTTKPPPRKPPATPAAQPELAQSPAHRSRDGSVSPSSRKRRRLRRNSDDGDNHLDSNSCDLPVQAQSTPVVPNIPASITTTPIRTPIVKPEVNDRLDHNSLPPESGLLKEKIEPAEPLLEPKTEYLEDLNNDDSVEDLTLDDDDEMDMSQMSNMSNMSRPGPSHGADISNQGFTPWQLGNQSGTDEVFMAAQEAVNAHRDSQAPAKSGAQAQRRDPPQQVSLPSSREIEVTQIITVPNPTQPSLTVSTQGTELVTDASGATPVVVSSAETIPVSTPVHDLVLQDQSGNVLKILKIYSSVPPGVEDKKKGEKEVENLLGASEIETLTASIASIASRDELFEVQVGSGQQETQSTIAPGLFEFSQAAECSKVMEETITEHPNEEVVVTDPVPEVEKEIVFNEEINKFQCQRCKKAYVNKTGAINHLLNQCSGSVGPKLYACDFCPYTAQMPVTLRVHLARNHKVTGINLNRSNIARNFGMVAGEITFPKARPALRRGIKEESDSEDLTDPDFKISSAKKKGKQKATSATTSRPKRSKRNSTKYLDETVEEPPSIVRSAPSYTHRPSTSSHEYVSEATSSEREESSADSHRNEFDFNADTGKYKCKTCKKMFKIKVHMEEHKIVDCRNKNVHQCPFCPYKGRTPTNVRVHIGHKHGKWPRLDENGVWIY